ncbi:MAG: histidine phosphatase family protein [Bacteroidia bacterium]
MKSLYLVRHASASIDSPTRKDIDRPLNHTGISEAEITASFLRKNNVQINLIISSTAIRAIVTAHIIAKHFFYPLLEIRKEESIFLNDAVKDFDLIASVKNSIENIVFVGHNPAITKLANSLCDETVPSFRPAAVTCIEFEIDSWKMLSGEGKLKFYADPSQMP